VSELKGKEIGGLPWRQFIEKYPHLEKKLQSIKVMSQEEYEEMKNAERDKSTQNI
jgi:hypothetical protein